MSLMSDLYVGHSGLTTSQNALNTTGNNLANIQTVGYTRQQVVQSDTIYNSLGLSATTANQIGQGVSIAAIRQVRDRFMDEAFRQESGRQAFYAASFSAVYEIETLFGEMEGVKVSDVISDLWESIQELSKTPNDTTALALFRDASGQFVERCTDVYNGMKEYQEKLNVKVENTVTRINELGYTIFSLNKQILTIESGGVEHANDLRDLRNNALDELSGLVHVSYKENADGYMLVDIEGQDFVTPTCYYDMGLSYDLITGLETPIWPQLNDQEVFDLSIPISTKFNTDIGELKAYILARGTGNYDYTDMPIKPDAKDLDKYPLGENDPAYINDMQSYEEKMDYYEEEVAPSAIGSVMTRFDQLFHGIIKDINDILSPNKTVTLQDGTKVSVLDTDNCSYGAHGEIGVEMFSRKAVPRYNVQTLTLADGTTGEFYVYNEENENDRNSMYTLGNVEINEDVMKDESILPMTTLQGDADVDRALAFVNAWTNLFAKVDPIDAAPVDYQTYYTQMIGDIANLGSVYKASEEALDKTTIYLDNQRQKVAGVSSNEELNNMIRFQSAYNASSRYFTVVSDMLEYLLSQLGTR